MLTTKHLEDYILKKDNDAKTVELGVDRGQRRLNEELLAKRHISLDLNEGYEQWIEEESAISGKLDIFLKWMINKSPEGNIEKVLNGTGFVGRMGLFARMAQGEYVGSKGDWKVLCVRRRGVVYLEEVEETVRVYSMANWYWGYRLEELLVRDPPAPMMRTEPTDIRMVMEATLAGHLGTIKLLYMGEMDAVYSDGHLVQVRHTKSNERGPGYWFWKEKSLKWWLQSRLVDADYLAVGLRDGNGIVHKLSKMTMTDLEKRRQYWHPSDCFNFLLKALLYIDENLDEGEAARVTCTAGQLEVEELRPKDALILTEEFIDHFDL